MEWGMEAFGKPPYWRNVKEGSKNHNITTLLKKKKIVPKIFPICTRDIPFGYNIWIKAMQYLKKNNLHQIMQ
jgi:hypothetical protein